MFALVAKTALNPNESIRSNQHPRTDIPNFSQGANPEIAPSFHVSSQCAFFSPNTGATSKRSMLYIRFHFNRLYEGDEHDKRTASTHRSVFSVVPSHRASSAEMSSSCCLSACACVRACVYVLSVRAPCGAQAHASSRLRHLVPGAQRNDGKRSFS